MIGTVTGTPEVSRVKNGTGFALMLQVRFSDARDIRTVQYMPQAGEDTVPLKGSKVAVVDVGGFLLAIASYDAIKSTRAPGEKEFYSSNGTTKLARLSLKSNGKIYAGNVVSGKNLRASLDTLSTALVTFSTGLTTGTLVAQAAALVTAVNLFKADLALFLDSTA